jgi:Cellulose biosynthesis protein BcsS
MQMRVFYILALISFAFSSYANELRQERLWPAYHLDKERISDKPPGEKPYNELPLNEEKEQKKRLSNIEEEPDDDEFDYFTPKPFTKRLLKALKGQKRLMLMTSAEGTARSFSLTKRLDYTLLPFPHLSAPIVQWETGMGHASYRFLTRSTNVAYDFSTKFSLGYRAIFPVGTFTTSIGYSRQQGLARYRDVNNKNLGFHEGIVITSDNWVNLNHKALLGVYMSYDSAVHRHVSQITMLYRGDLSAWSRPHFGFEYRITQEREAHTTNLGLVMSNIALFASDYKIALGLKNAPDIKGQIYSSFSYWKRY